MVVGTLAAYAFARLRFPGRSWLILAFMATYMLPPIALILPLYQIMSSLHLRDTPLALIIIYSSFVTPFVIWIMRGYIETISPELDDAARVDGCSRLGALVRVIVPVSAPGLASTALLAFLLAWDEFLYALIITQTNASKTLPIAINDFIGRHGVDFGLLATGGVIAAVPPVILAFAFQRYIVAGPDLGRASRADAAPGTEQLIYARASADSDPRLSSLRGEPDARSGRTRIRQRRQAPCSWPRVQRRHACTG